MSIEGPWFYSQLEYDVWGTVRNHDGVFICQVRFPHRPHHELVEHRRQGTDPYESAARLAAAAPALYATLKAILPLISESEQRQKAIALLELIERSITSPELSSQDLGDVSDAASVETLFENAGK